MKKYDILLVRAFPYYSSKEKCKLSGSQERNLVVFSLFKKGSKYNIILTEKRSDIAASPLRINNTIYNYLSGSFEIYYSMG